MTVARENRLIIATEVRKAVNESCYGMSGKSVFAMDSKMDWHRITNVRTHRGFVYGYRLDSGKWFVIHQWEER